MVRRHRWVGGRVANVEGQAPGPAGTFKPLAIAAAAILAMSTGVVGAWSMVEALPRSPQTGASGKASVENEGSAPERRCGALGQGLATRILGGRLAQEPKLGISTTSGSASCLFRSADSGNLDEIMVTYVADVGALRHFRKLAEDAPPDVRIEEVDSLGRAAYWETPSEGRSYGILSVSFGGAALVVQVGIAHLEPADVREKAIYLTESLVASLSSRDQDA